MKSLGNYILKFTLFIVLLIPTSAWGQTQLLTNRGAEDASTSDDEILEGDWINSTGGDFDEVSESKDFTPDAQSGSMMFFQYKQNNEDTYMEQTADVSGWAGSIDGGDATVDFSGWLRTISLDNDKGRFTVEFLDGSNSVVESFDSGFLESDGAWQEVNDSRTVPSGTRSIRLRLHSRDGPSGSGDAIFHNVYFDNTSLTIQDVNAGPTTIFVNADASSGGDGSSWNDAYRYLQDALDDATGSDQIWIAEGTYYPDDGANVSQGDPDASFTITGHQNGLKIYGGFAGDETQLNQRDISSHRTILSGDIDDNDTKTNGVTMKANDISGTNSNHVLFLDAGNYHSAGSDIVPNITTDTRLDGLIITGGQANGIDSGQSGGGLFCDGVGNNNECSPTLLNIIFAGNISAQSGGAMLNSGPYNGNSNPVIANSIFTDNQAHTGGAIYNSSTNLILTNVDFISNSANYGGALYYGSPSIETMSAVINNTVFYNNTASSDGNHILNDGEELSVTINHSLLENGTDGIKNIEIGTIIYADENGNSVSFANSTNIDANPQFVDASYPAGADGDWFTSDDGLTLQASSPAINTGDNDAIPSGITTDITGTTRTQGPIVDMGAYESSIINTTPRISNPIADITVDEDAVNDSYDLPVVFSDNEDNDADLTFSVQSNDNSSLVDASVDNSTDQLTLNYLPNQSGTANITIRAEDSGGETVDDSFTVTVNPIAETFYVDADASPGGNGSSWSNAFQYLQDALGAVGGEDEIWIAEGTYYPDEGANVTQSDETAYFTITGDQDGLKIYGGFDGTENQLSERNISGNRTILSGDIDQDDNPFAPNTDSDGDANTFSGTDHINGTNSNHVLYIDEVNGGDTIIDGFAVVGGQTDDKGGGLYTRKSTIALNHISFNGNTADRLGGAIRNRNGSLTITNSIFNGNKVTSDGGAISNEAEDNISLTIRNTVFIHNAAKGSYNDGGALFNKAVHGGGKIESTITNTIFVNNSSDRNGGAISNYGESGLTGGIINSNITNTIFYGNTASNGNQITNEGPTVTQTISHSLLEGGPGGIKVFNNPEIIYTDENGHSVSFANSTNIDANPQFVDAANPVGIDGAWFTDDDGLVLQPISPAVDAGDNSAIPSSVTTDIAGNSRIRGGTVDMGAYEAEPNNPPSFTSSSSVTLAENSTGTALDVEANDGEGNPADQNVTYTLSGTDSSLFSLDGQSGVLTFANPPNFEQPADANTDNIYEVTVVADDKVLNATQNISITVSDVNEAPTITSIGDQTINESTSTGALSFSVDDVDNTFGELTVTSTSSNQTLLPDANITLSGNQGSRTITLNPVQYQHGTTTVTILVNDGNLSESTSFELEVIAQNDAPVISGSPNTSISEGNTYSFTPTASDQENDDLSFSITNKPAWITFDQSTGKLEGTPANNHVGTYNDIEISVSDGNGGSALLPAFDITVNNVNDAPVVDAGITNQTATENKAFDFTIPNNAFNDVDAGDLLSLSVANLPDGLSFDSNTNTISGTPTGVDVGTNTVTVTAEDQSQETASTTFKLTVKADVPAKIVLSSPADKTMDVGLQPLVNWQNESTSQKYELQIATTSTFSGSNIIINKQDVTNSEFQLPSDLNRNTQYYWRVRGVNKGVSGDWSTPYSFTTIPQVPAKVSLSTPADKSEAIPLTPTVTWDQAARASNYDFQLSRGTSFSQNEILVEQNDISATDFTLANKLDREATYYWRVRGTNAGGNGEWSAIAQFKTLPELPAQVALQTPVDGMGGIPLDSTLTWSTVQRADTYKIQIANDESFSNIVGSRNGITSLTFKLADLNHNTSYYWRVRAVNSAGNGKWSTPKNFVTIAAAPALVFPDANEEEISIAPQLSWQGANDITSYRVQVGSNPDLQSPTVDTLVDGQSLSLEGLQLQTEYFWHVRVENKQTTSPYSKTRTFLTHGSPKEQVEEQQITFGDNGASDNKGHKLQANDYRLVGLPGRENVPVDELFEGEYGTDWKVFSDNGNQTDFLVEHSSDNPLSFAENNGFWVLSKKSISVGGDIQPVSISEEDTYSITLQPGWNIISNPFVRSFDWQQIQTFNQRPLTLFGYEGSFFESTKLEPFFAYYVYNDEDQEIEINIPYTRIEKRKKKENSEKTAEVASPPKEITVGIKMEGQQHPAKVHMRYHAEAKKRETSTRYMPPLELSNFGAAIIDEQQPKRKKTLHTIGDVFDRDRKHYTVEVKSNKQKKITWTPEISGFKNNMAVLIVEPDKGRSKILGHEKSYSFMAAKGRKQFEIYTGTVSELQQVQDSMLPQQITLNQNYPNPFNPSTTIQFGINQQSDVALEVFDILGRKVRTLVNGPMKKGWHKVQFNGRRLASGTYFYRLIVGQKIQTKKMVLIK